MNDEIDKARIAALFPRASKSEHELRARFPRGSEDFIKRNIEANAQLCAKEPERDVRPAVVDPVPGKEKSDERARVSIVMFRVRLLDPDNAYGSAKPLIDCLRTCNLISDDSEKEIELTVTQEKVNHFNEQRTEVKITYG
jgi:hypothetical protein